VYAGSRSTGSNRGPSGTFCCTAAAGAAVSARRERTWAMDFSPVDTWSDCRTIGQLPQVTGRGAAAGASPALLEPPMEDFDFGLGEDIDALRASVAQFAADRIAPRAADIDRENRFPRGLWPQMGELGLLGITVEDSLGGAGLGYVAHVVAME